MTVLCENVDGCKSCDDKDEISSSGHQSSYLGCEADVFDDNHSSDVPPIPPTSSIYTGDRDHDCDALRISSLI